MRRNLTAEEKEARKEIIACLVEELGAEKIHALANDPQMVRVINTFAVFRVEKRREKEK